ncbi:indole-3-glycerol-phosphate synthase [candidate division FCPU426 bacterium]|nr:indole-3-glycerol-phosphate synthase [candidate division FCPU426 bacterium]
MAKSFLKKVVKEKIAEIVKAKKRIPLDKLLHTMLGLPPARNFREALFNAPKLGIVAEVKRKAPGKPAWHPRIQLDKLLAAYTTGGALALSVVTETKYFGGKLSMIAEIKHICNLPVLRKDFIVDTYQVYESRAARADALLLIAEAIPDKQLPRFVELTSSLGMTPVVEVHTVPDLKRSLRAGADVILINNRDLNTLKVNMQTVDRLAKMVPRDNLVIAASGYQGPEDVVKISSDRVRAVLIGRALMGHKEPHKLMLDIVEAADKL